jgi:hypothetical protein
MGWRLVCRQVAAMLVWPFMRWWLRARLRRVAMTAGPLPVCMWEWSSVKVTSRIQWTLLSDRGCRFPAPRSSEPCGPLVAAHGSSSPRGRAGICCCGPCFASVVWMATGAVGVYEVVFRPAAVVLGDGLAGHRLADGRVPGLPLVEGVG